MRSTARSGKITWEEERREETDGRREMEPDTYQNNIYQDAVHKTRATAVTLTVEEAKYYAGVSLVSRQNLRVKGRG